MAPSFGYANLLPCLLLAKFLAEPSNLAQPLICNNTIRMRPLKALTLEFKDLDVLQQNFGAVPFSTINRRLFLTFQETTNFYD